MDVFQFGSTQQVLLMSDTPQSLTEFFTLGEYPWDPTGFATHQTLLQLQWLLRPKLLEIAVTPTQLAPAQCKQLRGYKPGRVWGWIPNIQDTNVPWVEDPVTLRLATSLDPQPRERWCLEC